VHYVILTASSWTRYCR